MEATPYKKVQVVFCVFFLVITLVQIACMVVFLLAGKHDPIYVLVPALFATGSAYMTGDSAGRAAKS